MNLKIRTFSMALAAMSATSYMYALPSNNNEEKSSTKEKKSFNLEEKSVEKDKKEERNVEGYGTYLCKSAALHLCQPDPFICHCHP